MQNWNYFKFKVIHDHFSLNYFKSKEINRKCIGYVMPVTLSLI